MERKPNKYVLAAMIVVHVVVVAHRGLLGGRPTAGLAAGAPAGPAGTRWAGSPAEGSCARAERSGGVSVAHPLPDRCIGGTFIQALSQSCPAASDAPFAGSIGTTLICALLPQ